MPDFSYHGDFGDLGHTYQLKDGTYRIKVELKVGKKLKTKVVRVNLDKCTFTPDVIVAFRSCKGSGGCEDSPRSRPIFHLALKHRRLPTPARRDYSRAALV